MTFELTGLEGKVVVVTGAGRMREGGLRRGGDWYGSVA